MEKNKLKFPDLMVDIETLGTKPGCVILSIGAVLFNVKTGEMGDSFETNIDIEDSMRNGLAIDSKTLKWWISQSKEAQEKSFLKQGKLLSSALLEFSNFIKKNSITEPLCVWGNSARFDLGIIEEAYSKVFIPIPWNFAFERDVRTLVSFAPEIKNSMKFEGIRHSTVDDCKHQIKYCSETWKFIFRDEFTD